MMKKLIMLLIMVFSLSSNHVIANIDESQTDFYYANGMLMDLDKVDTQRVWRDKVENLKQQNAELKNTNAKIDYNASALGGADDLLESFLLWMEEKNIVISWETAARQEGQILT